jgi:hypothetical protein
LEDVGGVDVRSERFEAGVDGQPLVIARCEGREAVRTARKIMGRIEARWAELLGKERMEQLRELLKELNALAGKQTPPR